MTSSDRRLVTFADGRSMPQIGLGVYKIGPDQATDAVRAAVDAGYRRFDLATFYGNEEAIGKALRDCGVEREDLFLTSKLWNDAHGRREATTACRESLDRLGVDRLDLYLIHWPVPSRDRYVETWESLVELREEGLVDSIGTSNFLAEHLDRLHREVGVVPVLNQIELHPLFQQPALVAHHERLGIITEAWSPLGRGRVLEEPALRDIAARHDATVAQVVLWWHLDHGRAVVPKSVNPARMAANLHLGEVRLTADDLAAIEQLDTGHRAGPDPLTFA